LAASIAADLTRLDYALVGDVQASKALSKTLQITLVWTWERRQLLFGRLFNIFIALVLLFGLLRFPVSEASPGSVDIPAICVSPENEIVRVGSTFTIQIEIRNVTGLYGVDVQLSWDPTIIQYVSHQKTIPAELYLHGVLHGYTLPVRDDVDETASMPGAEPNTMYWLAEASILPAAPFSGSGTVFTMTFKALTAETCSILFTCVMLSDIEGHPIECSHVDGHYQGARSGHDVAVSLEAPQWAVVGNPVGLKVRVDDIGEYSESNVRVQLIIEDTVVQTTIADSLQPGDTLEFIHSWTPVSSGVHNVTAYAFPVSGEASAQDNKITQLVPVLASSGPPIVFMYSSTGDITIGDTFTVSIGVAQVTDLYGLEIQLSWDSAVVQYVSHHRMVPVDKCPGGILHAPTISIKDDVDETAQMPDSASGTMYWLAQASMDPAPPFIGAGLAFTITFKALRHGDPRIVTTAVSLSGSTGRPLTPTLSFEAIRVRSRGQGDVNDDGIVDIVDVVQAAAGYLSTEGELAWNQFADLAPPFGLIDIYDLVTISSHYGKTYD
jgi:hypothetical protein